jgi:beta-lactamase regulating signal transducer with metallopeptidase domain
MTIAQYLLKLSVSLCIIYIFYALILRRLTFYTWNRWYLLGYSILAFYIPFININGFLQQTEWSDNRVIQFIPVVEDYTVTSPDKAILPEHSFNYASWMLIVFSAGVVVLLIRLLLQYISFRRIRSISRPLVNNKIRIYQVNKSIIPFSFGNEIFINPHQHTEEELEEIIRHELVHVQQKHTADILWAELFCVLNWYNPFAWLLRKAIRQNLEFIADHKVLESGIGRKEYQYLLLKVVGVPHISITHQFNFSSLKNRIVMMNKGKSRRLQLSRFLFLFPLLMALLVAFRSGETAAAAGYNSRGNLVADTSIVYIVNGVVQPNEVNPFQKLSPRTIVSLNVLKPDQATAKYGDMGKNGVVLITTDTTPGERRFMFTAEQMRPVMEKAQRDHILYIGIINALTFAEDTGNLLVKADGNEIAREPDGSYSIKTKQPGPVAVALYRKDANGTLTLLNTLQYTGKFLPPPDQLIRLMMN